MSAHIGNGSLGRLHIIRLIAVISLLTLLFTIVRGASAAPESTVDYCFSVEGTRETTETEEVYYELWEAGAAQYTNTTTLQISNAPSDNGCFSVTGRWGARYQVYVRTDDGISIFEWAPEQHPQFGSVDMTNVTLLEGDADNDNSADNDDLTLWQSRFDMPGICSGDGSYDATAISVDFNEDNCVYTSDYVLWLGNAGQGGATASRSMNVRSASARSADTLSYSGAPATINATEGDTFSVQLEVDLSGATTYEAVQLLMNYDTSLLQINSMSAGSTFNTFGHATASSGTIEAVIGRSAGATTGTDLQLMTITMTALAEGSTNITFAAGTPANESGTLAYTDNGTAVQFTTIDSVPIAIASGMTLSASPSDTTPAEGESFQIVAQLGSAVAKSSTAVTVGLDSDLTLLGYSFLGGTGAAFTPGTGTWDSGAIGTGGTAWLTMTVRPNSGTSGQTLNNLVTVGSLSDSANVTVQAASADLVLTKVVDDATPTEGDQVVYTVTLQNNGPSRITSASVRDQLPAGVALSQYRVAGSYATGTGVWTIGSVEVGQSVQLVMTTTVGAGIGGQTIINTATIQASSAAEASVGNESAQAPITVQTGTVALTLDKSVNSATPTEGDTIRYTLRMTNSASIAATNITVADALPSGLTYQTAAFHGSYNSGSGDWTISTLPANTTVMLVVTATVDIGTGGQTIVNSASLTSVDQNEVTSADNSSSASINVQTRAYVADLSIAKSINDTTPTEGDVVTWTVSISNAGPDTATGVTVQEQLPTGFTLNGLLLNGTYNSTTHVWSPPDIAPGVTYTLRLTGTIDAGMGNTTLTNTVAIATLNETDNTTGDHSASAVATVQRGTTDIQLSVEASDTTLAPGTTLVYTVHVTNSGAIDATNLVVSATLPAQVSYLGYATQGGPYDGFGDQTWRLATLPAGIMRTLVITTQVNAGTSGQSFMLTVAGSAEQNDSAMGNNQASVMVSAATPTQVELATMTSETLIGPMALSIGIVLTILSVWTWRLVDDNANLRKL